MFLALVVMHEGGGGRAGAQLGEAVLDAAAQYAVHEWTMTAQNETASCSSSYECDYSAGTHRGLPYVWGGYFTIP